MLCGCQNLDLSGCSAVANDALAALGGGCPRLVELYLSGCSGITTEGVKELAGGCQELEALHLADCENLDDEVRAIVVSFLTVHGTARMAFYLGKKYNYSVCRVSALLAPVFRG